MKIAGNLPEVDFIIPVFNEGRNILATLDAIYDQVDVAKHVSIVYDFEEDDTLPVVCPLLARYAGLELVRNMFGRGVVNAVRTGIRAVQSDIVVVTMADLSDDLALVPEMLRLIASEHYDVVCASRYMRGGQQIGGPWLKSFLSRAAGLSLRFLTRFPTHDATNSFRAYRRSVLQSMTIESDGGFEYTLEITAKAVAAGYKIAEIPSVWRDRTAGKSKFRLRKWLPKYLRWYFYALWNPAPNR